MAEILCKYCDHPISRHGQGREKCEELWCRCERTREQILIDHIEELMEKVEKLEGIK